MREVQQRKESDDGDGLKSGEKERVRVRLGIRVG